MNRSRLSTWFAGGATVLAAAAAAAGLGTDVYRDVPAMVDQARAADLATLLLAVPALAIGLWQAGRGSARARLVVAGSLAYLVYTYAIFAFQVVISPVTPAHIVILGLAAWALLLGASALVRETTGVGDGLPRRTTAGFLALVSVLFAGLWLGQIGSAIASGSLPAAVSELGLPTTAVYTLDLAFALPLLALAAAWLVRRPVSGYPLALAGLVFSVEMALSVFAIFAIQAWRGELADASVAVVFALIAAAAAILAATALKPRPRARRSMTWLTVVYRDEMAV
jgi:hypothetical protein